MPSSLLLRSDDFHALRAAESAWSGLPRCRSAASHERVAGGVVVLRDRLAEPAVLLAARRIAGLVLLDLEFEERVDRCQSVGILARDSNACTIIGLLVFVRDLFF